MMFGKENVRCIHFPAVCDRTVSVLLVPSSPFTGPVGVVHMRKYAGMRGDPDLTTCMRCALHRYPMTYPYLVDSRPCIIILDPNLANMGSVRHIAIVPVRKVVGSTTEVKCMSMTTTKWNIHSNCVGDI